MAVALANEQLHSLYSSKLGVLHDLINVLGPFSVIFESSSFCKVEFTYIFSAHEIANKITNII